MHERRVARCSCGALRAETEGEPEVVSVCHCHECQRRSGSPFGAGAFFDAARVHLSGVAHRYTRTVPEGRTITNHFCPTCGTIVYWIADGRPGRVGVAVGAFADPQFPPPVRSVYERSKHPWIAFAVEIEEHDPGPPD